MRTTIYELIKNYVGDELTITDDSELYEDLGISSLTMVSLLCSIEQKIDASIDFTELYGIKTVGQLIDYLENKENK